jgi:hypothetical protein
VDHHFKIQLFTGTTPIPIRLPSEKQTGIDLWRHKQKIRKWVVHDELFVLLSEMVHKNEKTLNGDSSENLEEQAWTKEEVTNWIELFTGLEIASNPVTAGKATGYKLRAEGVRGWGYVLRRSPDKGAHDLFLLYLYPAYWDEDRFDTYVRLSMQTYTPLKSNREDKEVRKVRISNEKGRERSKEYEKSLELIKENLQGLSDWWYLETENYILISNISRIERYLIKRMAEDLEEIRVIYEELFPAKQVIEAVSVVRVFKDKGEYKAYGGPRNSAGYWSAPHKELVFYDAASVNKREGLKNTLAVLYHEAFHQYIFYAFGEISPHSWFDEGHGDFFSGAEIKGSAIRIKEFDWRKDILVGAVRSGKYPPLSRVIEMTQEQYYQNAPLNYATGWSLVYFLRKGLQDTDHNPLYKGILDRYMDTLYKTRNLGKANEVAFEGVDMGEEIKKGVSPKEFQRGGKYERGRLIRQLQEDWLRFWKSEAMRRNAESRRILRGVPR